MKKKSSAVVREGLGAVLEAHGFSASSDGMLYARACDGVGQAVILTRTRYKDQYSVICAVDELEPGLSTSDLVSLPACRQHLEGADVKFALSPVAPFRNSYDWSFADEASARASAAEIGELVRSIALPWFASMAGSARVAAARDTSATERKEKALCALLSPSLASAGYSRSSDGTFLWKRTGEIFGVVLPSVLGFGSFLNVYLVLWSPLLEGQKEVPAEPPPHFMRVAYCYVARSGVTCTAMEALWFVGDAAHEAAAIEALAGAFTTGAVDAWLSRHNDVESLLRIVHPDMQASVRRRIEEASGAGWD
jgi:hypothetical protein